MKSIKIRVVALLLSCCLAVMGTVGSYEKVQAADIAVSAGAAGLEWLYTLLMSAGVSVGLSDLLGKSSKDLDNWDWGDLLDEPATQKQIDDTDKKINEYYDNAVKDWYQKHGGSLSPTPVPSESPQPPVTVAPVNPDDVKPLDYGTIKQKTGDTGFLAMSAATAYCLKEAVKGWWDDIIQPVTVDEGIPEDVVNQIVSSGYPYYLYRYNYLYECADLKMGGAGSYRLSNGHVELTPPYIWYLYGRVYDQGNVGGISTEYDSRYKTNLPCFENESDAEKWKDEQTQAAKTRLPKSAIWPSADLKDAYDKNQSPSYPEVVNPPVIRVPTVQEIKDLNKQGTDDEENRPTYVTNFITNHTVQATPTPEPTKKPDAQPTPTIAVVPSPGAGGETEPDVTPSITPAVNPDPGTGGGTDPKPTGSPGTGGGTGTDPTDPDKPDDSEITDYKTDLRLVFPFCIPFDLIHLFEAFSAEPEAPVFKIPIDLKIDNPFTGSQIVDFHDEIVIDMSDYEDVAKIVRILEVIAFLIGLMLITRQQMIKG